MGESIYSERLNSLAASIDEQGELISRCLSGEESAYMAVYNQYAETVYRLCFGMLNHREDAEEVLQDTFEYAFRRLGRYDSKKASFKTWLYQIAISRCRNKRRRKWLKTLSLNQYLCDITVDETTPTPPEANMLDEEKKIIWRALNRLSPKLRETTVLRYYEGLTYSEIGKILSIPAKTAESRMRLAHKSLRDLLAADDFLSKGSQEES